MIPFNVLFGRDDKMEYNGRLIQKYYQFTQPGEYSVKFNFVKANSEYNQAIILFFNDFIGEYYLNEKKQQLPQNAISKGELLV